MTPAAAGEHRPSTVYRRRVPWGDVDAAGIWRFVAALSYVEEAETQLMRELGILGTVGIRMPRVHVEADFRRPAYYDDEVEVTLTVSRVGRRSVHYEFVITRDGELAVEGHLRTVFVASSGQDEPLPPRVRAILTGPVG